MVCVECELYNFLQCNVCTAGNLRDHLRGAVDNRAFFVFVIKFAVDLRFSTEFFDNFDTCAYNRFRGRSDEHLILVNIFGTNAERYGLTRIKVFVYILNSCRNFCRKKDLVVAGEANVDFAVFAGNKGRFLEEVHLRRTDEACNEKVDRIIVQVLRGIYLLHETVFHNNDSRTHRHSFDLVVRNVDERRSKTGVKLGDFRSHRSTKLCVQVGQRFVEKEYLGFTNDRTTERNTLSLTTGECLRFSGKVIGDTKDFSRSFNLLVDDFLGYFTKFQTERHVVINGHVGIERVVLEYHRDVSVLGNNVVYELAVDVKFTAGDFFQTCDHTKRRRFTATGRTYQYDEFLVSDVQSEVEHCLYTGRVYFVNAFKFKSCHNLFPPNGLSFFIHYKYFTIFD